MYIGELKEKSVVAEITLTELRKSTQWAPTAFVGFRSVDGTTQLRAYLMQYHSEDKTLLAGYSVVENGKPRPLRVLRANVPLHEAIIFRVERDTRGSVSVQMGDLKSVVIGDGASSLRPFISVSSAKATVSWVAK